MDNVGQRCLFMGYQSDSKAYRLLDTSTSKVIISRDVRFLPFDSDELHEDNQTTAKQIQTLAPLSINKFSVSGDYEDPTENRLEEDAENSTENGLEDNNALRRSHRINKGIPPSRLIEEINLANESSTEDPKTIEEALSRKDHIKWELAMIDEVESMKQNQVWTLVQPPKNQPLVGCKWVFKCKTDLNGTPIRYKARLVAQGYCQDYNEIFAPVLHHTFRIILIIAGQRGLLVQHYDIECAFLNGDIEHDIYICNNHNTQGRKAIPKCAS